MKKIIAILFTVLTMQSVMAITVEQQQQAIAELEVAKAEIGIVKAMIPGFLKKSLGQNLENAEGRINNAQTVLRSTTTSSSYFCTIESAFDGQFSGRGSSELAAKNDAKTACQRGSRQGGFFCKDNSITCTKEN